MDFTRREAMPRGVRAGTARGRHGATRPPAHAGPAKGCGARAALRAAAGAHWRGPVARGAPRRSLALRHPPPPRRRARSRDSGTAPTAEPRRSTPAIGRPRGPAAASRPGLPHAPHKAAHAPILLAVAGVTLPGAARAPHPPARLPRLPPPTSRPVPLPGPRRGGLGAALLRDGRKGCRAAPPRSLFEAGAAGFPPARSGSGALARLNPGRARGPARPPAAGGTPRPRPPPALRAFRAASPRSPPCSTRPAPALPATQRRRPRGARRSRPRTRPPRMVAARC